MALAVMENNAETMGLAMALAAYYPSCFAAAGAALDPDAVNILKYTKQSFLHQNII